MSDHSKACSASRVLCNELTRTLAALVPGVRAHVSGKWCALFLPGRGRLAYVSHRENGEQIAVWCRGGALRLSKEPSITFEAMAPASKAWADHFEGRFLVASPQEVRLAAAILARVSYPLS